MDKRINRSGWASPVSLLLLLGAIIFIAFSKGRGPQDGKETDHATILSNLDRYSNLLDDSNYTAFKRDEYGCKKGTPCKQEACCGAFNGGDDGICGLGEAWCGGDCDSQCDAKAECGSWADPPGKECPLNVCCSEYGFCGSTEEFCTGKCQSNCVVEPPVPAGGSSGKVLDRVIGYYESWADARTCRAFPPSAIPVDGLTHVNFAFAYVDPASLEITTMDSNTPEELFTQTADIRSLKSNSASLEVWISIGGWTFSDNGTNTQGVFPDIASNAGKRQKFSDNLVSFMKQFGFDGVDLDWEYPGAPDRGGKKEDTANFALLLETMRKTFDNSGRKFGITITIPSSYWYLRWFDLPSMVEYLDWINLMSYDLHGVWDSTNPIGSIVQGHTNLTEIKQALDLLWRNDVPPGKIVLGLGFYGRSFQLENTGCSTPGCGFKGAAEPGPCTNSTGTLGYFEIMDVIKDQKPEIIHDDDAAVNYFLYGDDQWISYDDEKTFKAKVDFANSVGLGGVMIWAVDLDDNDFTALTGLVGKSLPSFADLKGRSLATDTGNWASQNGQKCMMSDCGNIREPPNGFALAPNGGPFPDDCKKGDSRWDCKLFAASQALGHLSSKIVAGLRSVMQTARVIDHTQSLLAHDIFSRVRESVSRTFAVDTNSKIATGLVKELVMITNAPDPTGDTGHLCGGGFGGGRQKVMCCNPPKNSNPFLPVSLDKLFPTLPPVDNLPQFDLQQIASGVSLVGNANPQTFGFVVIDGPEDAVSSLRRRDGSHLEFLSCEQDRGTERGVAQFVCMDTSENSNCDDMRKNGLAGTILRMPEECGFATYSVAHSVTASLDQNLPGHLLERAPTDAVIYDLEYSYDFKLAKRDAGDIFIRVDYSDSHDYFDKIVAAEPDKGRKRDLQSRYWSPISSSWKTLYDTIRSTENPDYSASLAKEDFNVLLFGDDGSKHDCSSSKDGFLKVSVSGSVKNKLKFGVTLVGTIAPGLALEEAYSYFDSDLDLSGTLEFDGKGELNIDGGNPEKPLFSSPITNYEFSHPGIVSFSPQLNVDVKILGRGQIDGKFKVNFVGGSSETLTVHAPPGLGDFGGQARGETLGDAFVGDVSVGSQSSKRQKRQPGGIGTPAFAINMNVETRLEFNVFDYGSTLMNAGATLAARVPHVIWISKDGETNVHDIDYQASSDVIQEGSVSDTWTDDVTHRIGTTPSPAIIHSGNSRPEERDAPAIDGFALFGERDWVRCSTDSDSDTKIECLPMSEMLKWDPSLADDDETGNTKRDLESRADQGGEREYNVNDANGRTLFTIRSHAYPNGRNGATLLAANPAAGRYDLENEEDCVGVEFQNDGDPTTATFITEHILELQTLPRFLEFAMGQPAEMRDGTQMTTRNTPIPQTAFGTGSNFLTGYNIWDPAGAGATTTNAPVDEIFGAFGGMQDASHLVNAEEGFNGVKQRIWRGDLPMADSTWRNNGFDQTTNINNGLQALSTIRNVASIYGYLNTEVIHENLAQVINNVQTQFQRYEDRYNANAAPGGQIDIVTIWIEYISQVLVPQLQNSLSNFLERRLNRLLEIWRQAAAANPNAANAQQIRDLVTEIQDALDQIEGLFIDTTGFPG